MSDFSRLFDDDMYMSEESKRKFDVLYDEQDRCFSKANDTKIGRPVWAAYFYATERKSRTF